ncbi:MAG: NAD(P)/FAD-dependent oxidoreductase [Bacteroidetes bacterium]|nr:NAD(P)/FAD-dependent oxidoreductase [Bacteroidota bacterium]MBI3482811.1 NAD(P)/FAD-dependent oxidoreductase [Bacteroidota bacterium]
MKNTFQFDLAIVGGGAAGFFGAIIAAETNPDLSMLILEKTTKLLSKVKVSGGGRCNVTHHCFEPTPLSKHYPRGSKELKSLFRKFQAKDIVEWFESKGVKLKTEEDGRIFPVSNNSQTIIDCLLDETERHGIKIKLQSEVRKITPQGNGFTLELNNEKIIARKVLIACGGYNNLHSYDWLKPAPIINPIPSLFTFNDSDKKFKDLMGVAVSQAEVKIAGTKFSETGPCLITHWGLSGPAVIKLSAWAAEYLHEKKYEFTALVNWTGTVGEEGLRKDLQELNANHGKQKIINNPLYKIPSRLWMRLCELAEIEETRTWAELPRKSLNRLVEFMIRCPFEIKGKTTFKEEFVTCGGVDLKSIDLETMESKHQNGIYFAGEVLNIDGETGGFNFQSAWTTAYVAAKAISES